MKKIRVLLSDDHKLMRRGLRLVIEQQPEFTVVGEADDGRQAVDLASELKPDAIVMDIAMPNLNGIEACHQITQASPSTSVVMLSMHADESYVLRALKAGARSLQEPANQFYGDRGASVRDICGNNWYIATQVEVVSKEEVDKRIAAMATESH